MTNRSSAKQHAYVDIALRRAKSKLRVRRNKLKARERRETLRATGLNC